MLLQLTLFHSFLWLSSIPFSPFFTLFFSLEVVDAFLHFLYSFESSFTPFSKSYQDINIYYKALVNKSVW